MIQDSHLLYVVYSPKRCIRVNRKVKRDNQKGKELILETLQYNTRSMFRLYNSKRDEAKTD